MLSRFFLDRPVFALVIAIVLMVLGCLAIHYLPISQYPPIAPPSIAIAAVYPGASAETVENSVTQIIEQKMTGFDDLLYLSATSDSAGLSRIELTFKPGTDPDLAWAKVQNKLQLAQSSLPTSVQQAGISVNKSTRNFLIIIGLVSEDGSMDGNDLRDYAQSNLEKAQNDAGRYSRLGDQGMATKQRVEYAETDVQNAKMQVEAAQAALQRTSIDLKHATITAPFDGTIGISLVKKGAYITAGQTLLNTVSSDNPMAVDFVISEKEITRFFQMKQQKQSAKDSLFTLVLADKSVYASPGQIEFLDRAVDPQTATLKVRLRFPNPKQFLKAGMSGSVRVKSQSVQEQALIPFKAVTEQMGEFFVYVVERDTAFQHKVIVGAPIKDKVIIKEGLQVGDRIVVDGVQKLRNATPVQIGIPVPPTGTPAKK